MLTGAGRFAAYVQHFEVTAGSAEKWFTPVPDGRSADQPDELNYKRPSVLVAAAGVPGSA